MFKDPDITSFTESISLSNHSGQSTLVVFSSPLESTQLTWVPWLHVTKGSLIPFGLISHLHFCKNKGGPNFSVMVNLGWGGITWPPFWAISLEESHFTYPLEATWKLSSQTQSVFCSNKKLSYFYLPLHFYRTSLAYKNKNKKNFFF